MNDEFKQSKIFCFDIETVIDKELATSFLKLPNNLTDSEVEAELSRYHLSITDGKNAFYRQPFWKVVCISYLECSITHENGLESYSVVNLKSGGDENSNEKELIQGLFAYLNKEKPRLVSFNGKGFDIPVLKYRSMLHKIPANWLYRTGSKWSNYNQRYSTEWNCDLLEVMSDFGASARIKMSEVAALLGVPCKIDVDGSAVADLFKNNDISKIRSYCEQDCLCTFVLYLYFALHQSRISNLGFDKAIESLENYTARQKALKANVSHIEAFLSELRR